MNRSGRAAWGFAAAATAAFQCFLLAGAAPAADAAKPRGEARADAALVYFLRGDSQPDDRFWIFDGKTLLAVLKRDSYAFAQMPPGPHLFWSRATSGLTHDIYGRGVFLLQAGRTYYVRLTDTEVMYLKGFETLSEADGERALAAAARYVAFDAGDAERAAKMAAKTYGGPAAVAAGPGGVGEGRVRIPAGTLLMVELQENLTTHHVQEGAPVRLRTLETLRADGAAVLPAGSPVEGVVAQALRAKAFGHGGFLEVEATRLRGAAGEDVPVYGLLATVKGQTPSGRVLGRAAAAAPLVNDPAIMLLAIPGLFVKGGDPWLAAGMRLGVITRDDVWVRPAAEAPQARGPAEAAQTRGPAETAPVVVAASLAGPVVAPRDGRADGDCAVGLKSDREVREAAITSLGEEPLPVPLRAKGLKRSAEGWTATFAQWDLLRYARFSGARTEVVATLAGTLEGGARFTTQLPVVYEIESEK